MILKVRELKSEPRIYLNILTLSFHRKSLNRVEDMSSPHLSVGTTDVPQWGENPYKQSYHL